MFSKKELKQFAVCDRLNATIHTIKAKRGTGKDNSERTGKNSFVHELSSMLRSGGSRVARTI